MSDGKLKLSYSKCSTFLSCRRRYHWIYVENLVPKVRAFPLQVGAIVHDLRERWVKGTLGTDEIANLKEYVSSLYPHNDPDLNLDVALEAARIFSAYVQYMDTSDYKIISPEMHIEKEFDDFVLYARLDGLAEDADGDIYRDEVKTAARMDSKYLQGYRKGLQTGISHWLMQETLDFKTRGTLFEILVKTKVPQIHAVPIFMDQFQVDYAKQTVHGIVRSINRGDFYPSSKCHEYNECDYEPLCRNDTPARREAFYTAYRETTTEEGDENGEN